MKLIQLPLLISLLASSFSLYAYDPRCDLPDKEKPITFLDCAKPENKEVIIKKEDGKTDVEKALLARVYERWDLLVNKRFETAYSYNAPTYQKAVSYDQFYKTLGGQSSWRYIEVTKLDCKEKLCEVSLILNGEFIHIRLKQPLKIKNRLVEKWLTHDKGKTWYFVPKITK